MYSPTPERTAVITNSGADNATVLYDELELSSLGLSKQAFEYAYKGYQKLASKNRLDNSSVLTICDLSQPSSNKRLYILDLFDNKVLMTSYVAHGRRSGVSYATRFSNSVRSYQSSLGFYITGSSYNGQHGLALKLTGIEPGFNNLATRRHIVIHGAAYVSDEYLQSNKFMGRSYGCPAVPKDECSEVINLIKDGTCFFIFHPTKKYLKNSRILNG
jgi:hypothetical protein